MNRPPTMNFGIGAPLLVGTVLSGVAVFYGIADKTLWNDEAFSFFVANRGAANAVRAISGDTQPPLYYILLSLFLQLGDSPFFLRLLSALATILVIPLLFDIARSLFGMRVAVIATALFAIDPIVIDWAQKARPYALQTFFVAVSFWGFVRIALSPDARTHYIGRTLATVFKSGKPFPLPADVWWLAYSAGGAFAILTQTPAGFFLLGCNAAMLVQLVRTRPFQKVLFINWTLAQLLIIVLCAVWLPTLVSQIENHLTPDQIAQRHQNFLISPAFLATQLLNLLSISNLYRTQPPFAILYFLLVAVGIFRVCRGRSDLAFLNVLLLTPLAICMALYILVHPLFGYVTLNFVWILLPYLVLVAYGLDSFRNDTLRWFTISLLLLANIWAMKNYHQSKSVALDQIASVIGQRVQTGDAIIFSSIGAAQYGVAYYLGASNRDRLTGFGGLFGSPLIVTPENASGYDRVWFVYPSGLTPVVDTGALPPGMKQAYRAEIDGIVVELRARLRS